MFYLHSIGMLPNYQNNGYGTQLLSYIKDYSKKLGCSEMFVITDKGNTRACHVYEKVGLYRFYDPKYGNYLLYNHLYVR